MGFVSVVSVTLILCLQTICICLTSTIGQYVYIYFLKLYPFPNNGTSRLLVDEARSNQTHCVDNVDVSNSDAQLWAQQRSSDLFFWTNLFTFLPLIGITYILGLYTNKLGRRFLLILPFLGYIAQFLIWTIIIYFNLPEYFWYIAALAIGFSGSNGILTYVLNLNITENTNESKLSTRFIELAAIQTTVSSIAAFTIGYYINWYGFLNLYWSGTISGILAIMITLIFIDRVDIISSESEGEREPLLSSVIDTIDDRASNEINDLTCSYCFQTCSVFKVQPNSPNRSTNLLLILFSNIFYNLASASFAPFIWFLLNSPFCWTSTEIGHYSAVSFMSYAILSVIGMQILTRIGANDATICLLSHIAFGSGCFWLAIAQHSWEIYGSLILSAFSGYQSSLTYSMMSKWLNPEELTHAFTLVTAINTVILSGGTALFNWIYSRTVLKNRSFTLYLGGGLCIIPAVLNICLLIINRQNESITHKIEAAAIQVPSIVPLRTNEPTCILVRRQSLPSLTNANEIIDFHASI